MKWWCLPLGNITSDLLIWTPDEGDLAEPDVYLAAMAASMEDGLGERLRKQEEPIAAQVSLGADQSISSGFNVQYSINTGPTFNSGLTVNESGSITLTRDGVYTIATNVYTDQASGFTGYCVPSLRRNGDILCTSLVAPTLVNSRKIGVASMTTSIVGAVDDVIDVYVAAAGGTTTLFAGTNKNYNTFSVTLVTPT